VTYTLADLDFSSVSRVRAALAEFTADRLTGVSAEELEAFVRRFERGERVFEDAPLLGPEPPRWGHDHDFGTFQVAGQMGTRHVWMLSRFFDQFGVAPDALAGRSVLDAGCWSGGVSLALRGLGAIVTAIDEDAHRARQLGYLVEAFGLRDLAWRCLSIYGLARAGLDGRFDAAFCLGVVYHLTDPIVALRRLYHALRPGGLLCLESMSLAADGPLCQYAGPSVRGNNCFIPAPRALAQWLEDTGFEDVRVGNGLAPFAVTNAVDPMGADRCFAVARRRSEHRLTRRGGFSVPVD
jgi:2-polyprenyl-3-methyl-5-hydroxy-6-metoxy-1,4-benzoquinol methylase